MDKWQDLKKVINKINDSEAVNKFFDTAKHVLTELGLTNEDELVYASAINNIQLTVGGKYVTNIKRKNGSVVLGFYIPAKFLNGLGQKYPNLKHEADSISDAQDFVWLDIKADQAEIGDFLEPVLELARLNKKGQKSPHRSQFSKQHNEWIIEAALNPAVRSNLFSISKYYVVGAYWEGATPENQTESFVGNGIWENGYDDKFLEEVNEVPVGSQIAIKAVFTKEKLKSVMAIKARGIVTGNPKDGRRLNVQWESGFKPFEVDFPGGYWATIKEVTNQDHIEAIWNNKLAEPVSMNFPLNTIFYGPPGTGKTYTTLLRAAQIIENREIEDYEEAKRIFNDNLGDRIEFITFHQNYSYEDFIQGLRPDTDNGAELSFKKVDGVFKRIADRALKNLRLSEKAPEEVSRELQFEEALDEFIEELQESEGKYKITEAAYIFEVEEDAFRYKGDRWNHANGLRMKFSDLRELYIHGIASRQEAKSLKSISRSAYHDITYYFLVYQQILKHIPQNVEAPAKVKRQNYVIIIDEINRANISRVFGELITLIEPDKRSHGAIPLKCTLPSGEEFVVPSNLYIIGTMNTADKSIALLDIALRRRFEFEAMYPKYQLDGQQVYDTEVLEKINKKVVELKGHDFQIGHAYFMGENNNLVERMNKKVIPLLLEYFLNDEKEVSGILAHAGLEAEDNAWPLRIKGKRD
ncbi:AAA family ATPase [Pontibacter ramchanderi]|uniref:5-methylcytosine-specific restriction protein B n=1 Tax=Pontibacter ramchanderi TaxID=1179743 RepID=A0A2N3V3T1_9BACT|nr:AAA family ATPase [Pontibacter ramchanderi]PKV76271.1 5-methylcytosine-specific restriction protein B [Pontibacter ramchanderi]